jgi:acyl carrier protein
VNSVDHLCELISRQIPADRRPEASDIRIEKDTALLESGVLDSLSVLSIVAAIETEIGIEIPESEIVAGHFLTPAHLWDFVSSLRLPE